MRKIKDVLRLKYESGLSQRRIARSCAIGKTTVAECLSRFATSGLSWPTAAALDEATLERTLYPPAPSGAGEPRPCPDWIHVHRELRRKGVTLMLLWHEHRAARPEGFGYTWFCEQYRAWAARLDVVMRQEHRAGEKLPGSRRQLFEQLDRPALRPLPAQPYEFAEWKPVRVNIDYHVEVDGHYYSVPYTLVRRSLQARYTERTVEVFHKGQRVASHIRSRLKGRHTTGAEHMPESHRRYAEWTPQRLIGWAEKPGRPPPRWSAPSSSAAPIPSRASAPVSAFCASARASATRAWKRPAGAPFASAPAATKASNRSCAAVSTASHYPRRRNWIFPSITTTSAVPITTTEHP